MVTFTPDVLCDLRLLSEQPWSCGGCHGYFQGEPGMTMRQVRAYAAQTGWKRRKGPDGKLIDVCPVCAQKEV